MFGLKNLFDSEDMKKRYARVNVYNARSELGYQAKRSGISTVVRKSGDLVGGLIESGADAVSSALTESVGSFFELFLGPEIARNLGLFAGTVGGSAAGVAGVGIAGAISAGFAQMDYFHQKSNLRTLYAEELGAKLGKAASKVTVSDMEGLAEDNPALEQELKRARRQRNFAVPLAVVATLASFAAVTMLLPEIVGSAALTGVLGFVIKMAVSMASYCAVKMPLQALGNLAFDLQKETANDRIVDIRRAHEKGVEITPQDLVPVFTRTNPALDAMVTREFNKHFEELPEGLQQAATLKIGEVVPLERLARDINSGAVRATELLFSAGGEHSGVRRMPVVTEEAHTTELQTPAKPFCDKLASRDPAAGFSERVSIESTEATLTI